MPILVEPQSIVAEATKIQIKALQDRLLKWVTHPEEFVEEGLTPPTRETIELAIQHVLKPLSESGRVPPSHVVPDAHGGIVFERRENGDFESIHVHADGHIEFCVFHDGRLVDRQMWL